MMGFSVGRGVACCGLLCFYVGEFGEFCTSSCFREKRRCRRSQLPRPVGDASNEERLKCMKVSGASHREVFMLR